MATQKGFIKDWAGRHILPITRGELVLDQDGKVALNSEYFLAGANGNGLPGLITAAERAMLTGGGQGGGISDLYEKLGYINHGFKVNGSALNFYNSEGQATPINFVSANNTISVIAGTNNVVNFGLVEVPNAETTATQILKGISVDKYGRVTSVTSAALNNSDIPEELVGKKLKDGTLENFKTLEAEIGSDPTTVANKAYVDAKVAESTNIAHGALKFGGAIDDATVATGYLSNREKWNSYYKVTATSIILSKSDFYETTGLNITGESVTVKVGDTLIVYPPTENAVKAQFIYIPSGDELTAVTIRKEVTDGTVDVLRVDRGNLILRFSDIFNVTNTSGTQVAAISMAKASSSNSGYLSSEDYKKFSAYENTLTSFSYVGDVGAGSPGSYKIGTLTFGNSDYDIYGKYSIATLTLNNGTGTSVEYNPILTFTSTGSDDVNITLAGTKGIFVKKNTNGVEIGYIPEIITQDVPQEANPRTVKYLTVTDGYKLGVQIGKADAFGNVEQDGLTDFSQFNALVSKVSRTVQFELIDYSLKTEAAGDPNDPYRYGNTKLQEAVYLTI